MKVIGISYDAWREDVAGILWYEECGLVRLLYGSFTELMVGEVIRRWKYRCSERVTTGSGGVQYI
jgi:hypothetical protein